MLSRVTHLVLLIAVIVLATALVRVSRNQSFAPAPASGFGAAASIAGDQAFLFSSALFDPAADPLNMDGADFEAFALADAAQADGGTGVGAGIGDGARDRSPGRGSGRGDWRDDRSRGGRDGGDRQWNGGGPGMQHLSDELVARCLEVAREVDDELADRLIDARNKNPEEFERQMKTGSFGRRLFSLAMLKTRDPILYGQKISELSQAVQIERVAKQLRELKKNPDASLGDLSALEAQLRMLLVTQFAMSMKARGDLLCRFEERAAEVRRDIEHDASNFQSIIDARMKMLASEPAEPAQREGEHQPRPVEALPAAGGSGARG